MRRFLVALSIASVLLTVAPLRTYAANLHPILPECDQSMYEIQNKSTGVKKEISAELYDTAGTNGVVLYPKADWAVVNYTTSKACGFDDFLKLFVNLFNWGLYVLSVLALFFFFLGGGTLMLSGGSEERVRTGKAILVNTVIGLAIALSSWVIVNLTINVLRPEGQKMNGIAVLFNNQPWFRVDASNAYVTCTDPPAYPCKSGKSSRVGEVQAKLVEGLCYSDNTASQVDGGFGPDTRDAWHRWQIANGVSAPTDTLEGYEGFSNPCIVIPPL
jgi:hypothetical protein